MGLQCTNTCTCTHTHNDRHPPRYMNRPAHILYLMPSIFPDPASRCKKWDIPVEKVYNKTQRQKFAWAIDMADETFVF